MDLKQYIPQIIASILVLAGGGSLQYQASHLHDQASNEIEQTNTNAESNNYAINELYLKIAGLTDEISALKRQNHN